MKIRVETDWLTARVAQCLRRIAFERRDRKSADASVTHRHTLLTATL